MEVSQYTELVAALTCLALMAGMMFAGISSLAIFVILDLEYPRAGFIRIDAADAVLREVRGRM